MNNSLNYSGFSDMFFDATINNATNASQRAHSATNLMQIGSPGQRIVLIDSASRLPVAENTTETEVETQ
ncbi:MAG: hypothetical protein FD165_1961 [Gammaproteobacteria bacterium]|nr:MAG: hypothetical protein FD165_1961 [Gammaproteobacteria bacterium]TND04955.1 MAG: hypothetical protein FD120_1233 [Gammaproteobacteria bacterium]